MKYVICVIDGKEQPIIVGEGVDLDQLQLPWPIVSAGVGLVQEMFVTCQGTQTVNGKERGSRGLADEIILRMSDHID